MRTPNAHQLGKCQNRALDEPAWLLIFARMSQYLISAVRQPGNLIEYVKAGVVSSDGKSVLNINLYQRQEVISWINAGHNVNTSITYVDERGNTKWPTNAKVVLTPDRRHITTTPNNTTRDNLENLPAC